MIIKCVLCNKRVKALHANRKYCDECSFLRQSKNTYIPNSVTEKKMKFIRANAGILKQDEICKKLSLSVSSVKRAGNALGLKFKVQKYSEETVREVLQFYEKQGLPKTRKKFPKVSVRSIVERHEHAPRCIPWTDRQKILLFKITGLVSYGTLAKYFNRPCANKGSIVSFYSKNAMYSRGSGNINGIAKYRFKKFLKDKCPSVVIRYSKCRHYELILWVDAVQYLKDDCPDFIKKLCESCSDIQSWLWGKGNVRRKILNTIKTIQEDK